MSEKNFFVHIFGGMWRLWDFLCRVVINVVITVIVLLIVLGAFGARHVVIPSTAALVVDLQGDLVEQFSGDPTQRAMNRLLGQKQQPQTRLRDVVEAIDMGRDDNRIKALVLETDEMEGAGMEQLQYIAHAVRDFEKAGKTVFTLGDSYDQAQYYLASNADVIFIHPQGEVFLHGFGIYQPYFKDALDKLGVDWNVFRVGKYKSAVEPFIRNDMSPEAREDYSDLLGTLWAGYQMDVTRARKLPGDAIKDYIDGVPANLAAVDGDGAKLALDAKLVDKIADHDQMEDAVAKVVGRANHSFRGVEYRQYLDAVDGDGRGQTMGGNRVGVVVAEGDIMNGDQPPGSIGGDSTSELIREARYDDSIKAVVLRVDSPGGSSFASDLILREIELTKEAGKPVVVSMGDVAASGGYWISMAGDKIYASPSTITGSIGIFGMLPTFQDSLSKIGVHTDGVGTTKLSDAFDITRPMAPEMQQAFQLSIDHGYREFITKVAKNRHMKVDDVDAIAQGRVWAGSEAKHLGLVDAYGDMDDAVAEAAKLADIGSRYSVDYIEKQPSFFERVITSMADDSDTALGGFSLPGAATTAPWYARLMRLAGSLSIFDDPRGIYAYCFCDVH